MAQWLVKSEAQVYSIDNLRRDKKTSWEGVRNYQARNYLLEMKVGDQVLFYHSSSEPNGIVGLAKVEKRAEPDLLQFDPASEYYDEKASKEKPRWYAPTLQHVRTFKNPIELKELKAVRDLKTLPLLQRGSRLSVHPVTDREFAAIMALSNA